MHFQKHEALELARRAAIGAGASPEVANSLADAIVAAEFSGNHAVGFAHLIDYLRAFAEGRIVPDAMPEISFPSRGTILVDAKSGIAQLGFDRALAELLGRAKSNGIAMLRLRHSYTVGELGYYTRRLAEHGLLGLAVANTPALMTTRECREPVLGTNPLSFAGPTESGKPFVIDQSSSATAWVNVRRAAECGETIPEGWALDEAGAATTDAGEALRGALLAFGGARGANVALMVEVMAAGLSGGAWSLDAPSFETGSRSPSIGMVVLGIVVEDGFAARLEQHVCRLEKRGMRIPGRRPNQTEVDLPEHIVHRIEEFIAR
jgi:(2R)-3-sulfolactate dehydrogenase (NADP+)